MTCAAGPHGCGSCVVFDSVRGYGERRTRLRASNIRLPEGAAPPVPRRARGGAEEYRRDVTELLGRGLSLTPGSPPENLRITFGSDSNPFHLPFPRRGCSTAAIRS
ncbi:hypothetical protein STVIR_8774 [Streptomyces viridochromogenes Tue57]|uniref:Uncharacterized protein n=1 Tax=Streptomyces viridochromogenes Tue57 TaxID=1160705 RepID=L8P298_STRVR|nr:hypothetical protein STVIR_8774 [Streptomyces viridochromogenes Tue57]